MKSMKVLLTGCWIVLAILVYSCRKEDPPTIPIVETVIITDITQSTAIGGGQIVSDGGKPVTSRGVCWGETNQPKTTDNKTTDGAGDGSFVSSINDLAPGVLYYVRAYATNGVGTGYGDPVSFRTSPVALAELTTTAISEITANSAKSGGTLVSNGGGAISEWGVCWSLAREPKVTDNKTTDAISGNSFTSTLTNLEYFKTYYVRAYATNPAGTVYGNERELKTAAVPPTLTTGPVTNRSYRSATVGGEVTADGGNPVTDKGICFATHTNPKFNENNKTAGNGLGPFAVNLADLEPNTVYHARAYAATAADTAYGADVEFKTLEPGVPQVTTRSIAWIQGPYFEDAKTGGEVVFDGGSPVTERGVCWSTTLEPTINDRHTIDGSGTGIFNSVIPWMELFPPQEFHVRAYAKNAFGIGYGADESFYSECTSVLYGVEVLNITGTSAEITCMAGNLSGIRYEIRNTRTGSTQIVHNAIGIIGGSMNVSQTITGLDIGTLYLVNVMTESDCVSMGWEVSFTTANNGLVLDMEGNEYRTRRIGNQVWMTENLKATKYNNGNIIPYVPDVTQWTNLVADGLCWYENNASYKETYGALYNWYTVSKGNLCPEGWHVPTDAEWASLETFLGGISIAGGKMKEEGTLHWQSPNTGATNESGFTGLPGGYRDLDGVYHAIGRYGEWWTSTGSTDAAWDRHLVNDITSIVRSSNDKNDGFSVRCIQDNLK